MPSPRQTGVRQINLSFLARLQSQSAPIFETYFCLLYSYITNNRQTVAYFLQQRWLYFPPAVVVSSPFFFGVIVISIVVITCSLECWTVGLCSSIEKTVYMVLWVFCITGRYRTTLPTKVAWLLKSETVNTLQLIHTARYIYLRTSIYLRQNSSTSIKSEYDYTWFIYVNLIQIIITVNSTEGEKGLLWNLIYLVINLLFH